MLRAVVLYRHRAHDMDVQVAVWYSGDVVGCIIEVTLCRAQLVLRWMTVFTGIPFRYVISHQVSLLPLVGCEMSKVQ